MALVWDSLPIVFKAGLLFTRPCNGEVPARGALPKPHPGAGPLAATQFHRTSFWSSQPPAHSCLEAFAPSVPST